jgi:hypothetical protein
MMGKNLEFRSEASERSISTDIPSGQCRLIRINAVYRFGGPHALPIMNRARTFEPSRRGGSGIDRSIDQIDPRCYLVLFDGQHACMHHRSSKNFASSRRVVGSIAPYRSMRSTHACIIDRARTLSLFVGQPRDRSIELIPDAI